MVRETLVRLLKALLPELTRRLSVMRSAARGRPGGARECAFAPFSKFRVGRGARGCRRTHPHRLQHRERDLRPDDVRRAGGGVQGDFGRAPGDSGGSRWRPIPKC